MSHTISKVLLYFIVMMLIIGSSVCSINDENHRKTTGQLLVEQLQKSIVRYQQEIEDIEKQSFGIHSLLSELETQKTLLQEIKHRLGITQLETQLSNLTKQLDAIAPIIYARAFHRDVSLYQQLSTLLTTLYNDPEIKKRTAQITKLKKELYDIIENDVKIVAREGKIIYNLIGKDNQQAIDQITTQMQQVQSQITSASNTSQAVQALTPIMEKIKKIRKEIALKIQDLSYQNQQKIKDNKDLIEQRSIMLELLRDPKKAAQATPKDIAFPE